MKYMGWGYRDLMTLPAEYKSVLVKMIDEDAQRAGETRGKE